MNELNEIEYKKRKSAFNKEFNRIEPYNRLRELTKNENLRREYKNNIIKTYNDLTEFLHSYFSIGSLEEKIKYQNLQKANLHKLVTCFTKLQIDYTFGKKIFDLIDIERATENSNRVENVINAADLAEASGSALNELTIDSEATETASENFDDISENSDNFLGEQLNTSIVNRTFSEPNLHRAVENPIELLAVGELIPAISNPNFIDNFEENLTNEMAFEYISNVSRVLKNEFDGDADKLDAFVTAIEIANEASTAQQQPILVKIIRSKLIGTAKNIVPEATANATAVINLLKEKIKGDNTDVVTGRLLALRADRSSMQKFQEQAELLADKLKNSYIADGIPADVANKMTIQKTVEMCRFSARTLLVKSVLASTKFDEPKEVLAKFITEATVENTEVKILAFRNNGRHRGRGGYNNNSNFSNSNRSNNWQPNNRNNYNRNFNNNFRGRSRGYNGQGGRGRGGNNFNGFSDNRNNNNNFNANRGNRHVRTMRENYQAPTEERGNDQQHVVRNASPNIYY